MESKEISTALKARRNALAELTIARQYEESPELVERYGEFGREKCLVDTQYHLDYLIQAIAVNSKPLFVEYMAWIKILMEGLHIDLKDIVNNLDFLDAAIAQLLDPTMASFCHEYLEEGSKALARTTSLNVPFITPEQPFGSLARQYLDTLLEGNRQKASRLILETVAGGTSVEEIYLYVFQPVQYEIGRLWQINRLSVGQEHFCSAATQLIMAQLYEYIFATEKNGLRLVAACVGGDLHEIGLRMVSDFFELEGWDTFYLGANTPLKSINKAVHERAAHLLVVSATMSYHVAAVADLITSIRQDGNIAGVKILVGGYPFNNNPELWRTIGADGWAKDARETINLANKLLNIRF